MSIVSILIFAYLGIKENYSGKYLIRAEVVNSTTNNITKVGISTDPYWLNFGKMIANKTNITKIIDIQNPLPYTILAEILVEGNASSFLIYPNDVLIRPKEKKSIYVKFYAKEVGNFTGNLSVKVIYPTNKLSEWMLVKYYEKGIVS